jgi:rare lipoprotein A
MSSTGIWRLVLAAGIGLMLAGCADGAKPLGFLTSGKTADDGTASADSAPAPEVSALSVVEKDVEAPDVFKLSDKGLWDGRPSLGGVWVAHSTVSDPERVIIRNPANGNSVIGALFRREAANPGPSIQVSSDAASALGLLAGSPATLEVVALRRQELPEATPADSAEFPAAPTDPVIAEDETAPPASGDIAAASVDPIAATAAAAIDKAEGIDPAAPADDTTADATDLAVEAAVSETATQGKCPFWRKKKCEAERAATAALKAPADAATAADATPDADGTIAAVPLDAGSAVATTATAGTLNRAYIQIGIFSVEANAQRAADQMNAAGMTATVRTDQSQGKTFWRVIIGPAASIAERDALVSRVKGIGYPDAYPVTK